MILVCLSHHHREKTHEISKIFQLRVLCLHPSPPGYCVFVTLTILFLKSYWWGSSEQYITEKRFCLTSSGHRLYLKYVLLYIFGIYKYIESQTKLCSDEEENAHPRGASPPKDFFLLSAIYPKSYILVLYGFRSFFLLPIMVVKAQGTSKTKHNTAT